MRVMGMLDFLDLQSGFLFAVRVNSLTGYRKYRLTNQTGNLF